MCSVPEDIEELGKYSKKQENNLTKSYRHLSHCKKCGEGSILVLQKKDAFCRKCFFEYCDHKFRSTIGKNKKIKHGEKVLLACSGGRKSAALLHMTKKALESASVKQISFVPGVLFIDDSAVAPSSIEGLNDQMPAILKELKSCSYPVFFSSLSMAYKLNDGGPFYWNLNDRHLLEDVPVCEDETQNKLKQFMSDMSLSAKLDFIKHLRLLLMTEIASHAGFNYLFVGDTACSLASNLLTDISLGRGSQISSDTSFLDTRYSVPVCRPIREFLNKEITLYNHLNECSYFVLPELLTKTDTRSSVQRLTESFITNLQGDFPATVFTIFRTGGKLSKPNDTLDTGMCFLCKSKLDNLNPDACSALEALKLSEALSHPSHSVEDADIDALPESPRNYECSDSLDIFKYLCHGCSIPFRHNKQKLNSFPFMKTNCVKLDRHEMKNEIKDFLLIEDESS